MGNDNSAPQSDDRRDDSAACVCEDTVCFKCKRVMVTGNRCASACAQQPKQSEAGRCDDCLRAKGFV